MKKALVALMVVLGITLAVPQVAQAVTPRRHVAAALMTFLPSDITVTAGQNIDFANGDVWLHGVMAFETDPVTDAPLFDSGLVAVGGVAQVEGVASLAPRAEGYRYRCTLHPGMTGRIFITR